jgi:tetratricopeptide (TPR) repeat protein
MRRFFPVALVFSGCLMAAPLWLAQAPVAGDTATGQNKPAGEGQQPAASQSSTNPFPEDTSTVPVMPSKAAPDLPEGTYNGAENAPLPLSDEDLDPVRSPDDPAPAASGTEDSSSSLAGLEKLLPKPEDDQPSKKRKLLVKEPTHQEASSKDIEVGDYYLQTKNWKAALSRFESAMVLDPENPEVYWGLAEAEHHLGDFANARAHYLKLLDYDPDGPHGKQARKELKDPAIVHAQNAQPSPPAAHESSK